MLAGETGKRSRRGPPGSARAVNHHGGSTEATAPGRTVRSQTRGKPCVPAAAGRGMSGTEGLAAGGDPPAVLGAVAPHLRAAGRGAFASAEL